jgi:hypothetical protein
MINLNVIVITALLGLCVIVTTVWFAYSIAH